MLKLWTGLCVISTFACAASFASVILNVTPVSQTVANGANASVDINIAGLGDHAAPSLGSFDISITFDPAILTFESAAYGDATVGDQLNPEHAGSITTTTPSTGAIELFELSLDPANVLDSMQASSFRLADLSFATLGKGVSDITITVNALADSQGSALEATATGATIDVAGSTNTPESASFLLVAVGIAVGGLSLRKRPLT